MRSKEILIDECCQEIPTLICCNIDKGLSKGEFLYFQCSDCKRIYKRSI